MLCFQAARVRRRARRLCAVAATAGLLLSALPARADTKLKLAVASVNEGLLPIRVAMSQGFFKAEGIDVELVDFRGGGPAVQGFASGGVDLCICAADHVVRLVSRGFDARIIVGLDEHHSYALLTKTGASYTDVKSLKGRKIGVTSPGALTDNTIRWAIKQAGLQAERDFQIVNAGGGASMRAALETGQVDAGTVTSIEVPDYVKTGRFRIVTDWRSMDYSALVVIGRQRWVTANPAVARGFVRAVSKAARLIQSDQRVVTQGVKTLFPTMSEQTTADVVVGAQKRLSKDGSVSSVGFDAMLDVVLLSDPSLKRVKKSDVDLQPTLSK